MRPLKCQSRPTGNQAARTTANTNGDFTVPWRHDPYEPLTPDDRADLDVVISAAERGFRLSVACLDCGHWLTNPISVAAMRGPRCRAKAAT